jgi:transcriptional regulator with XRE-family HTH domain
MTEAATNEATRIGAAIKARRYDLGLTTAALAEAVGISDRHLRYIESGEKLPGAPLYRKLADELGVTLPAITGDDEDREPASAAS